MRLSFVFCKPLVLWIVDGVGWGWDIRAKTLSELMPEYKHCIVGRGVCTVDAINAAIEKEKPSVIVCFAVSLLSRLVCDCKVVTSLTGTRILE